MASQLLEKGRSIFFTPGCSFLLLGKQTLRTEIDIKGSSVRDIFEDFIELPLLTYPDSAGDLRKLVLTRLQSANLKDAPLISPFTEDGLVEIFESAQGITRNVIRYCYQTLESAIVQGRTVDSDLVRRELQRRGEASDRELSPRARVLASIIHKLGPRVYSSDERLVKSYGRSASGLRGKLRELESLGFVRANVDESRRICYSLSPELVAFYTMSGERRRPPKFNFPVATKGLVPPLLMNPTRWRIVQILSEGRPLYAPELFRRLGGISKAVLIHNLTLLENEGLVASEFTLISSETNPSGLAIKTYSLTGELNQTVKRLMTDADLSDFVGRNRQHKLRRSKKARTV